MAAPTRDLIVNLVGRTNQLMGPLQGASAQLGQLGGTLTRTLTPAAAAFGVASAAAFREFDAGADAIRVGTGATGAALDELTQSMRNISTNASVASLGVGRVGEILADVSTTTGATGGALDELTTRFAQLERMGQSADVSNVARVFGDWTIATEDQSRVMDQLFLAAQQSGASIDDLSTRVVQFGAPLRNLGFEFEEATALIASFQKNGVNLETVMGGLRMGIGRLARAGEDVPDTFQRVVDEIANAEDASESTRLAIELFGQRAGPDLADAIRNGQFAVEDMLGALESGADSIDSAARDTTDLTDKLAALRNRLIGTLGPFGELGAVAGGVLASLGPMMLGLSQLGPILTAVGTAFKVLTATMMANPFVLIAAAVVALGALLYFHREKVLDALTKAWEWVKKQAERIWNGIKDFFRRWWPLVLGIMTGGIGLVVALIVKNWDAIKTFTWNLITAVVDFFRRLPGMIVDAIESAVGAVLSWFDNLVDRILSAIGDLTGTLIVKGYNLITGFLDGIKGGYQWVTAWLGGMAARVINAVGNLARILWDIGSSIINGLWDGMKDKWNQVTGWLSGIGNTIRNLKGPIEKDRKLLVREGNAIMEGLADGMAAGFRSLVAPELSGITSAIGDYSGSRAARSGSRSVTHVKVVMPNGRVLAEAVAEANRGSGGFLQ